MGVDQLNIDENLLLTKYRYQELYDTSISIAAQNLTKNKLRMNGKVKSSANNGEIPLGPFCTTGISKSIPQVENNLWKGRIMRLITHWADCVL